MTKESGNDPTGSSLIKIQTDLLNAQNVLIKAQTDKIDLLVTSGLLGVVDSLSYRVEEIEKHLHNREKWFGAAAVPNAEIHVADRMDGAIAPFQLVAGNNDFGSWVQILGSSDTPVAVGMVFYDGHRFMVTTTNSTDSFIVQIVAGESADIAARIAAEEFTEAPYVSSTNNADSGVEDIISSRIPAGQKAWARCANVGGNGTLFNFYFGIHEYIG